jgi:hypothetical protein
MESKDSRVSHASSPFLKKAGVLSVIVAGGLLGLGQKLADAVPSWIAGSDRKSDMRQANQRIDRAMDTILGISEANADIPGSCDAGCSCCGCGGCCACS